MVDIYNLAKQDDNIMILRIIDRMIKNDGSEYKELASGVFSNINVTSYNIYFTNYKTGEVLYTPTSNPGKINSFRPGSLSKEKS